jgi:hypothetical protein
VFNIGGVDKGEGRPAYLEYGHLVPARNPPVVGQAKVAAEVCTSHWRRLVVLPLRTPAAATPHHRRNTDDLIAQRPLTIAEQ